MACGLGNNYVFFGIFYPVFRKKVLWLATPKQIVFSFLLPNSLYNSFNVLSFTHVRSFTGRGTEFYVAATVFLELSKRQGRS